MIYDTFPLNHSRFTIDIQYISDMIKYKLWKLIVALNFYPLIKRNLLIQ